AWSRPEWVEYEFNGHFLAPNLCWLEGRDIWEIRDENAFAWQQITLDMVEPIAEGLLILVVDAALFEIREYGMGILVWDDTGAAWLPEQMVQLPDGDNAVLLRAPHTSVVNQITISYPLGKPLGVVGISGFTDSALTAANAATQAIAKDMAW